MHVDIYNFAKARTVPLIALLCFGSFGVALFLQLELGMAPCPLCIVQRYFILLCGIAVLPMLVAKSRIAKQSLMVLTAAFALGGLGTASRHMWVQAFPPPSEGCLPGLDFMLEHMPLTQILPKLFRGTADCATVDALFLGITIPQACAVVFSTVLVLAVVRLRSL